MDHYTGLTGPIDLTEDSETVRMYKAAAGAIEYALIDAGWTQEQIANGMRTYFQAVAAVLAEKLRTAHPCLGDVATLDRAADYLINPEE